MYYYYYCVLGSAPAWMFFQNQILFKLYKNPSDKTVINWGPSCVGTCKMCAKRSHHVCTLNLKILSSMGSGDSSVVRALESWLKGSRIKPCWSGGKIFISRINFLCWLLFLYPFHPLVTAVAHKIPWSFCQKRRWQVTATHAYTLCMWLCMKWHGAWLYGVHRTCRDGSSFMWHQPCQRCKYTTSVDIQKCAIKSYSLM